MAEMTSRERVLAAIEFKGSDRCPIHHCIFAGAVWNPQHHCMGTKRIGDLVGGRVCIRTDIDRQWVTPFGTPEAVENAVKEAIEAFGTFNGGAILHGEIGPEAPFENIKAMYDAFHKYGQYPLTWLEK